MLIFTGMGLMGRELINIHSSDVVVIVGGRSGTLGEFAIAYESGKLIGVLKNTGGVSVAIQKLERQFEQENRRRNHLWIGSGSPRRFALEKIPLQVNASAILQNLNYPRLGYFLDVTTGHHVHRLLALIYFLGREAWYPAKSS